jgi:hypothetical protein
MISLERFGAITTQYFVGQNSTFRGHNLNLSSGLMWCAADSSASKFHPSMLMSSQLKIIPANRRGAEQ